MNNIIIKSYAKDELQYRGVLKRGSMWVKIVRKNDCEVHHEASEEIYILKGSGCIVTKTGEVHYIRAGKHIMIKGGTRLTWHISSAITYRSRCF